MIPLVSRRCVVSFLLSPRALGVTPSDQVVKALQDEESETNWPVTQVTTIIDSVVHTFYPPH
jgi:hypothetical protein